MDEQKLEKINADIEKTQAKIKELQAKLKTLTQAKADLYNERILGLVRSEKMSEDELNALIRSIRSKGEDNAKTPKPTKQKQEEMTDASEG